MTEQRNLKRRVRERMEKTGERYAAARAHVVAAAAPAPPEPPALEAVDDPVVRATGRPAEAWFDLLDAWGAAERTHGEIATHLREEQGVPGWWAQNVTVAYERARGRRALHQRPDGFSITATRTIKVDAATLFAAVSDAARREAWAPGAPLRTRTEIPPRSARFDWEDGRTRVIVSIEDRGDRSTIAIEHARLADADEAAERKAWWRERLDVLRNVLEG